MKLSLGQERLWLIQQLDRTSAAYNIPLVLRFARGVDFAVLRLALDRLADRHPVLRSAFGADASGGPVALPMPGFRIPVIRRTAADNDWERHTAELVVQPFDLPAAPPVRAVVVECGDGSAVLCLVMHHLITDGRSIQIVVEDLVAFYGSATPAPLETTYADFVAWQRASVDEGAAAAHLEYWRHELAGFEPLRLPVDRPRSAELGFAGDHVDFALSPELSQQLRSFALRQRCALSSTVAALFQALLSLHSGQEDVTIGTVLAGRDDRRFADVLGFFVNTVVLRTHITPSMSFRELLQVARGKMVDAYAHQQAPFEQVVAELRPDREPGRNAIFDVVVVHNGEIPAPDASEIAPVPWAGVATRFDLELVTHVQEGTLHGSLVFRTDLFDRATANRLAGRFVRLVGAVLEHPDEPIAGALRGELGYWRGKLAGAPVALELPADRVRGPVAAYRGESIAFAVDAARTAELDAVSARTGVELADTLLAAFALTVSRYARSSEVTIATPTANSTEPPPGFDTHLLVQRIDLAGDPGLPELLGRVRETTREARAHRGVPFERLVAELVPRRDFGRVPLAQVAFQLGPDAEVAPAEPFDLGCRVVRRDGGLAGWVDYNAELFDPATAQRFTQHLEQLLTAVAAAPEQRLSALSTTSEAELRLLREWNDTSVPLPAPATVPAVFAERVREQPGATALICGPDTLTYAELDARSNRLARRLRAIGSGPGALIGVCLPRSAELITALLAILKTGAAYLPIDPEYPDERRRLLGADSGARLVITDALLADPAVAAESADPLPAAARPDDLAYVIYTSGSTGRPKGVEIEHRSIIRLVTGVPKGILGRSEVLLHASAVSFDAATFEIWGALLTGATCVVSTERVLTARPLAAAITRHRISTLWLTSSLFNHIVDEDSSALTGLRHLLVGGEALSTDHVRRALAALPGTRLVNGYGPTECTTFATCHPITGPIDPGATGIPIGRPIGNTRAYILDAAGRPTPIGVPGRLHLAGPGVARGYRGRPELTARHFRPDPFGPPGDRLYDTGDLARHNADGDLEYLGRGDDQVKIRGYRIEPREIEAALLTHPDIAQAAVVARAEASGGKRLVAYLRITGNPDLERVAPRVHLRRLLPEYMIPAAFVALAEFPRTINGKLDTAALPDPGDGTGAGPAVAAPPRTAAEEAVAAIWAEVLGTGTLGRDDNFFDVGGHSLQAARLVVRLQEAFETDLPLRTLFERPTIAGLAAALGGARRPGPAPARSFDPEPLLRAILPHPLPAGRPGVTDVLLTGATGFVGAYLVRALLSRPGLRVHCLVRAVDEHAGWHRLRANLEHYGLWPEIDHERMLVVPGDLAAPGLGLTPATFDRLARDIGLICHNGARVDALASYEQLAPANIDGTRELIRLAATTRLTRLQFVSTISAGEGGARSGYAETKSHAERLITAAAAHGVPAAIYRLPRIVGDSRTGLGNTRDIMLRVLRVILELGAAPATELTEPWLAVDETAELLARFGMEPPPQGGRFVLTSGRPVRLTHLVELLRSTGTELATLPIADWLALLATHSPEEHAILRLLFDAPDGTDGARADREFAPITARGPADDALLRYVDRMLARDDRSPARRKAGA